MSFRSGEAAHPSGGASGAAPMFTDLTGGLYAQDGSWIKIRSSRLEAPTLGGDGTIDCSLAFDDSDELTSACTPPP